MTDPAFRTKTFFRKRNALREAIRSQGAPDIQTAWDAFEGYTDCLTMEDAKAIREAALREAANAVATIKVDVVGTPYSTGSIKHNLAILALMDAPQDHRETQ